MRGVTGVLTWVVAIAMLAGCGEDKPTGGGGDGGGGPIAPPKEKTPQEAFEDFKAKALAADGKGIWRAFSASSRAKLTERLRKNIEEAKKKGGNELDEAAKDLGCTVEDLKSGNLDTVLESAMAKQFEQMAKDPAEKKKVEGTKWVSAEVKGDKAYCKTSKPDSDGKMSDDWLVLVKEDGEWRMDMEETEKYEDEMRSKVPR
jgi:hypothetical protein